MVVIAPPQYVHMQRHACRLAEALQPMVDHLSTESADLLILETEFADEEGTIGKVNDGSGKGLIERGMAGAEASKASPRAESRGEGAAEGEEGVFGGVVVVDYEVGISRASL